MRIRAEQLGPIPSEQTQVPAGLRTQLTCFIEHGCGRLPVFFSGFPVRKTRYLVGRVKHIGADAFAKSGWR